jgi:hypothetical protein
MSNKKRMHKSDSKRIKKHKPFKAESGNELSRIADYTDEVKKRMEAIRLLFEKEYSTPFRRTNIEFYALQFRKILELIALSSLLCDKQLYAETYGKIESWWNASDIFKCIAKENPDFYPQPIIQDRTEGSITWVEKTTGFLTQDEFVELYGRSANLLHAGSLSRDSKKNNLLYDEYDKGAPTYYSKIIGLLNEHIIHLSNGNIVNVLMQAESDNKVHVSLFQKIEIEK